MNISDLKQTGLYSWIVVGLLLTIILAKGLYAFFLIGDLGQPTWDYRPVKDVPGESPYAVYELLPNQQHVRGSGGE
jgi:hypothetical protein